MRANWFIGHPVDPGQWYEPFTRGAPDRLRLVHPADLHVTFAFLGRVGRQSAEEAWMVARDADLAAVEVSLGKLGAFGHRKRPSAYALNLEQGRQEVVDAMNAYQGPMLDAAGVNRETRPPRPHVTVARLGRRASDDLLAAARSWAERTPAPKAELLLDRLALYTWSEDRSRQAYQIVEERRLR